MSHLAWAIVIAVVFAPAAAWALVYARSRRTAVTDTRAEADDRGGATWAEIAGNFQKSYEAAKTRAEVAEPPSSCVYADCDEDPTSSIVDTDGRATGLCERHSRRWARLDEDERRKVRTGQTS